MLVIHPNIISMEVCWNKMILLRMLLIEMKEVVTKEITSTYLEEVSFNSMLEWKKSFTVAIPCNFLTKFSPMLGRFMVR